MSPPPAPSPPKTKPTNYAGVVAGLVSAAHCNRAEYAPERVDYASIYIPDHRVAHIVIEHAVLVRRLELPELRIRAGK